MLFLLGAVLTLSGLSQETITAAPPKSKPAPAAGDKKPAAQTLLAGAAKIDVTHPNHPTAHNEKLYVRALVLKQGETTVVLASVDAVAIGEIGPIGNSYLGNVREALKKELNIQPENFVINASHCHGIVCADIDAKTVEVVKQAVKNLVPVKVGSGVGHEDRIMENRRLILKSGKELDVRHAYSLPPDEEVASVGPIDPQIGILKLDSLDGKNVAVVYNFAMHPIQGVPSGLNTADITGFSSRVIENNLSDGAIAVFIQGCGGDVNPVRYKDTHTPRDAEPLGNTLALSVLKALRNIKCTDATSLKIVPERLKVPRANNAEKIEAQQARINQLVRSIRGTSLNLKTFLPLIMKYDLAAEFPSYYSHAYMQEKVIGRNDLVKLDAENRRNIKAYIDNIHTMERISQAQTNLALLKKHYAAYVAANGQPMDVEVIGLRVGEFVLVTFPGELVVQIGLNIKKASPHPKTFVAGYTNGYIYYSPTEKQLKNVGGAQEDSDCRLAPGWQKIFEDKVAEVLKKL